MNFSFFVFFTDNLPTTSFGEMSEPFKLVSEVVTTTARTLVSRDKFRLR